MMLSILQKLFRESFLLYSKRSELDRQGQTLDKICHWDVVLGSSSLLCELFHGYLEARRDHGGEVKGQRHEGEEQRRKEQQSSVRPFMACWSA